MRNIFLRTNMFDLLNCQDVIKSSCDKLVSRFDCNKISTNGKKS